jgi:WD repeat and SOF domain-containing protein 1
MCCFAGSVKGITFAPGGEVCVSVATDCSARLWRVPFAPFESGSVQEDAHAVLDFHGKHAFKGVDHHWTREVFATAGAEV